MLKIGKEKHLKDQGVGEGGRGEWVRRQRE